MAAGCREGLAKLEIDETGAGSGPEHGWSGAEEHLGHVSGVLLGMPNIDA